MTQNEQYLREVLEELSKLPILESDEIPGIDLYMDQVTTFMDEQFASSRRSDDEKVLTKTMINNYAKNKLLPPPQKKKYSREHMLLLIFIYYFKGVLSLQDIQSVLTPINEKYFQNGDGLDTRQIYDEIFSETKSWSSIIHEDVEHYKQLAASSFTDASAEDQDFLQFFSLICSLSLDIYLKKKVVEKLIDKRTASQTPTRTKHKHDKEK